MSNPPASLRVRRTQTEILLGPAGICWAPNIDKLCAGHRECTYKDTVSALKNFEVQSRKLTNYQIVIIEMISAMTQQVQGTLGDTSLGWGGEGRRRKVWFFQEEGAASAKTGHTRTIIHLWTCKFFVCSWSTECKWRNGQKWGWRGKQIKRLYGHDVGSSHSPKSQGEQLQEFQQRCDLTPFGLEKN